MFTTEQKSHFEAFGFLLFRQSFSGQEMKLLADAYELAMAKHLTLAQPVEEWECVIDFALANPDICRCFLERDEIYSALCRLLGADFVWYGASFNWFGESKWHPDQHGYGRGSIKILIYLDSLHANSGCLRVIPGSHRPPLHEALEPHQPPSDDSTDGMFGLRGANVPALPFESNPGDAILFSKSLWHGAFATPQARPEAPQLRRMASFSFGSNKRTTEQLGYFRNFFQKDAEVSAPDPLPEEQLKRLGRARTAAMIERLTEMDLKSPALADHSQRPEPAT